jgi:exonuclease SbcD
MRLLHVSDWHLGRQTYGVSRAADHEKVTGEIIELARTHRPHLIVHSGDLFDGLRPPYAELDRGVSALQELAAIAPVVVVAGNHDSPALFRLFDRLLGPGAPIRFVDRARRPGDGGILEFPGEGDEAIRLAPLPFVHANRLVEQFEEPETWMAQYADRIGVIESAMRRGLEEGYDPGRHVLLYAAHLFVGGATFSRSERPLHVSDQYASRLEAVPTVSYAAFGHIHKPQALPGTVVGRYAGSPIALDFGEEDESKVAVLVDARPGRPAVVETLDLSGGRPLRRIQGTLEEIAQLAPEVGDALCLITVRSVDPITNLADQLAELLPAATILEAIPDVASQRLTVLDTTTLASGAEPTFRELFRDFLADRGTRGSEADRVMRAFGVLVDAVETEAAPVFPELVALEAPLHEATS